MSNIQSLISVVYKEPSKVRATSQQINQETCHSVSGSEFPKLAIWRRYTSAK